MKKELLAAVLSVVWPALRASADTSVTWGNSSGIWSNPANWTPNVTPENNGDSLYDAAIAGGTVSLDINPTIQQLDFSGGTLSGASTTLTLNDLFNWTGGTVGTASSSQTINANGGMSIDGSNTFLGGTINSNGTATWSSGSISGHGQDAANQNTILNNNAGQNFNIQCDQTYSGYGSGFAVPDQFNNYGTVTKSLTTGTTSIGVQFNNSGTVNVQSGTLNLPGGGNQTGSFDVSSGATLGFGEVGIANLQTGSSVTGAGNVTFGGDVSTVNGTYNPSGATTLSNHAEVTFSSPNVAISGPLNIASGIATFVTGGANINPSSIDLVGQISGSDTITTSGLFNWMPVMCK